LFVSFVVKQCQFFYYYNILECHILSVALQVSVQKYLVCNNLSPRAARRYAPPPMAVSRGGATSVADGSAVHTSLVAGQLQAASVRRAQAAAPRSQRSYSLGWDRQTDGSLNAPLRLGIIINNYLISMICRTGSDLY